MQGATILTYMSASYMLNGPSLGIVIGYESSSLALPMNVRQWKAALGVGVFAVSPVPSFLPLLGNRAGVHYLPFPPSLLRFAVDK